MKDDWLNKNLEEKLGDYDSPMDLENAWESLQSKRQKPKKKNRIIFFWMIFGLASIGFGGSYFMSTNANILTKNTNEVSNQIQVLEKTKIVAPTLFQLEKTNPKNTTASAFTKSESLNSNAKNVGYKNQFFSKLEETKSIVNTNTLSYREKNNNTHTSNSKVDFSKNSNPNFVFQQPNKEENTIDINPTISEKEVQPIAFSFLPSLEMRLLEVLKIQPKSIAHFSFSEDETIQNSTFLDGCIPPHSYFNISAGYGIRPKGKVFSQENSLDVISFNALYEKRFLNRKLYFKTGITFDQFVNSIETTTEKLFSEQDDNQLIIINYFQNGTIENIFGTAEVSKIEMTTEKNYNRYRLISIPLILGYDLVSSNKTNLQIEGGLARSIIGFHSGKKLDLADADFEKQGVWQGLYGFNFNLRISRNAHLFTSVKGNYHFNKIGKSSQLDIEKFSFHQVQLGLKFKL